jgi:LEA14-like dessication related protein
MNRRLVALTLIGICFVSGCKSLNNVLDSAPKPTARVIGTELKNLSLDNLDLVFSVEVANPYPAALPLLDLAYKLGSGGNDILQGSIKPPGSVPARGSSVIQLPARIAFATLIKALKGVSAGSVVPYQANLELGVDAPLLGRLTLPLSQSGELPIPAVPHVELSSLAVSKLSLDQITTSIKLRVKNTNQFPLDLTKLNVSLVLGGLEVGATTLANGVKFPAGDTATLDVPLSFSPRAIGMGLLNLLRGNQIAYSISGSIDADSRFGPLALPFSHTGNSAVTQ